MSVHILNHNDVASLVTAAYKQMTGLTSVATLDLTKLVDIGQDANILDSKEQFTEALANVIYERLYLTDHLFDPIESDPFYVRADEFGAILAAVCVDTPETTLENRAWQTFVSGTTEIGTSVVRLPSVSESLVGSTVSWSIEMTLTKEQWNTAFDSADALARFVNAIYTACYNGVTERRLALDRANRNNFIGELVAYAASQGATGTHVIDLNTLYNVFIGNTGAGATAMTTEQFLNKPEAMIFAAKTIDEYRGYLEEPSGLFNLDGKDRFIGRGEAVVQVLSMFENQLEYAVKSDVYHKNIVALPNHRKVTAWQGFGDSTTFDNLSTIKVKTSSGSTISQSGVVAFIADPRSIIHTIKQNRVVTKYYEIEDCTQLVFQYVDSYANMLQLPAVVFTVEDYSVD